MKTVTLKQRHDKKYREGYVLLESDDVFDHDYLQEGDLFELVTAEQQLIGTFYYGIQNKGMGYKVSDDPNVHLDAQFFIKLFRTALEERTSLYNAEGTNAFRLYNGEGDGLGGLTIDNYDGHLLIQWYSKGIYYYHEAVIEAIDTVFSYQTLYEKLRFEQNVTTNQISKRGAEFPIMIQENFLFYNIHFEDGPMTGLFLDQREVRKKIMSLAEGGDMLNLFAYSGGFSLAAAKNGMKTTSVDIAKRSLELIEQNFALNEIPLEGHFRYTLDTFDMFRYCLRKHLKYDLIVIDPPSFSRSKKRRFSVRDNYHELIEGALPITKKNGYLVLSTNASNYSLSQFKKMIQYTLQDNVRSFEIVDVMGLPKDFKTTQHYKPSKYLKVVFVKILD